MSKGIEAIRIDDENDFYFDVSELNESERRALKWLVIEHDVKPETIERKNTGADFVVATDRNEIAIEVKLREPYSLSENQMEDVNEYGEFYVVVAKNGDVRVADKIESVEFGDPDDFYVNYYPWADDAVKLYDILESQIAPNLSYTRSGVCIGECTAFMILDCVYGLSIHSKDSQSAGGCINRDEEFKSIFNSFVESCHEWATEEFESFVEDIGDERPDSSIIWWPEYFSDEMGIDSP